MEPQAEEERKVDFAAIEKKWQKEWQNARIFDANPKEGIPKYFATFPYPYVNGAPHIGHAYSFLRTDAFARFKRMQGYNVLWTQGFHATGEPILGTIERLRKGDKDQISTFKKYGVKDEDLKEFLKGPREVATFWMNRWIADLNAVGAALDWRRKFITTTMTPTYSRFIEWQYNTLRKKGYVVQGTHPVIWCPHDLSPTGDHDRLKGEGESPQEFICLKFTLDDGRILPAATLRPETIFGVTNIWLNPIVEYAEAKVGNETWIVSDDAASKLADQQKKVQITRRISGKDLVGKKCRNPQSGEKILILPGWFVSESNATGVVMSVPAHAPYDYAALEDLKKNEKLLAEFNLDPAEVRAIAPKALISVEGFGEFPAIEACKKLGVTSQEDRDKLEAATKEVYKNEFHKGKLNSNCGKYAGIEVSKIKDVLAVDLKKEGKADSIWEPTAEVVCRCTTKCHVKILENQWFLKFSDEAWKQKVRQCLAEMKLVPPDVRLQFENTIEWLQNKACCRRSGMGTPLPWDKEWIVETLSDSTIYMAYYTIARVVNEKALKAENLPDELFDYVFNTEGTLEIAAKKSGLPNETINEMKREFEYFYPVDMRNSAVELVQNHLTYYMFHHTALFRKQHWPKGISVNGWVQVEGEKMSKSKGNIFPMLDLVEEYGADVFRLNIITSSEGLSDADWKFDTVKTRKRELEQLFELFEFASQLPENASGAGTRGEALLESRINSAVKNTTVSFEGLNFRTGMFYALHLGLQALKEYAKQRGSNADKKLLLECLQKIVLLSAPLAPHCAEELWQKMGGRGFASSAAFPVADESKIDPMLEKEESFASQVAEDVAKVVELTRKQPAKITIVAAAKWKRDLLKDSLQFAKDHFDIGAATQNAMKNPQLRAKGAEVPAFLKSIGKTIHQYKAEAGGLPSFGELETLQNASQKLAEQFKSEVLVVSEEDARSQSENKTLADKAAKALPFKPALLLE
ncbi:MAG: leucine--tRNA ligase [Candidatus Micrarchaeia archaeon]|jgi:leucyl-tRNA synthetase